MRLIRDERACAETVEGFVRGRLSADEFMLRFSRLWHFEGGPATSAVPHGMLDEILRLCETYRTCLPDGCGYRVSEEQFRKEVQRLALGTTVLADGLR